MKIIMCGSFREDINVFGAILRLVEWNGAYVTFLTGDKSTVNTDWLKHLHATVKSYDDSILQGALLWRGNIVTDEDEVC